MTITSDSKIKAEHSADYKYWMLTLKTYWDQGDRGWDDQQVRAELNDIGIRFSPGSHTPLWLVKENENKIYIIFGYRDQNKLIFYDEYITKISVTDIPKIMHDLKDVQEYCREKYGAIFDESPGPTPEHGGDDPIT